MTSGIYKLIFSSGRYYIGASQNCTLRFQEHLARLQRGTHTKLLQAEFDAYGPPSLEIMLECAEAELVEQERAALEAHSPPLNTSHYLATRGPALAPGARQKISATHKKLCQDPAILAARRARFTPEVRKKISDAAKAQWANPAIHERQAAATRAAQTAEYREKISRSVAASWEHRKRSHDDETKKKMSAAAAASWTDPAVRERRSAGIRKAKQ